LVLAAALLAAPALGLAAPEGNPDAAAAFARLKTLVGEWRADGDASKAALKYELIAGGTTLVERETGADRPEMIPLYHLAGDRLLLPHFCMAGNQPRMQLRTFDGAKGELTFEFVDATNLKSPAAGHMHAVTMRLVDANQLASDWQFHENGAP